MTSRLKEVTMEEIPDITSDIIEKLKKLNINSVYQLAVQAVVEDDGEFVPNKPNPYCDRVENLKALESVMTDLTMKTVILLHVMTEAREKIQKIVQMQLNLNLMMKTQIQMREIPMRQRTTMIYQGVRTV
jgi:hypothetical protein